MKKNFFTIYVCIIVFAIIYTGVNLVMIESVKNVKTDFFNIVNGKAEQGIDYGALTRYDYSSHFKIESVDNLNLEIKSVFHNFKKGCMNVRYSFDINKDNEEYSVGAGNIKSKWYIRKLENRWVVYKIDELP